MTIWITRELLLFIFKCLDIASDIWMKNYNQLNYSRASVVYFSSVWIYHGPHTYTRVKSYGCSNLPTASVFNFYHLDILCARTGQASEMYSPFEFLDSFRCSFRVSRHIMGFMHTPESKILVVWIYRELPCSISSISIYYAPESEIRVKCYDHLNYSRASIVHFLASWYIMGLTHTPESNVIAVGICREFSCSISGVLMYYAPELDIWLKSNDHLNFSRASVVHFRESRYIMSLTHTPE